MSPECHCWELSSGSIVIIWHADERRTGKYCSEYHFFITSSDESAQKSYEWWKSDTRSSIFRSWSDVGMSYYHSNILQQRQHNWSHGNGIWANFVFTMFFPAKGILFAAYKIFIQENFFLANWIDFAIDFVIDSAINLAIREDKSGRCQWPRMTRITFACCWGWKSISIGSCWLWKKSNKRSQLIMKLLITDTPEEVLLNMLTRDILWIYCQTWRCGTTRTMIMTQTTLRPFEDKTISMTTEDFEFSGLHVFVHIWTSVLQSKVSMKTYNDPKLLS